MRGHESGLTLIEILVALAIFGVVVVGTLGVLGATATGGAAEAFPVGFTTARVAKDMTVASTYLQGLEEYLATYLNGATTPATGTTYSFVPSSPNVLGFYVPSAQPYQLDWRTLDVRIERWHWDCTTDSQYSATASPTNSQGLSLEEVVMVRASLAWVFKGESRTLVAQRFVPYRPDIPFPPTLCP